ncbi:hypothetical protein R3P38DRAFT_3209896 [Favolaschia claudopus]|uniref:Uncharacterized protein n=1 Tax=Favolaschia claudopus TaxID=2862362 RepID=A0AAW0AIN0_9AGAR
MVQSIAVISSLISQKKGIPVIASTTLVSQLVPPNISDALHSASQLQAATTRVPFFETDWQATGYGFCTLPALISASATLEPPGNDCSKLVFAVDTDHPKTAQYIRTWARLGGSSFFRHHFIIVLWLPPISHQSLLSSRLSSIPSSRTSSPAPGLPGHIHRAVSLSQLSHLSSDYSHSPISEVPSAGFGDRLVPNTSFADACAVLGISAAEIKQAERNRQRGTIIPLIRGWDATSRILAKFCVSAQSRTFRFSGGLEVSFSDILWELGWVEAYFQKKSRWLNTAMALSNRSWPIDNVPAENTANADLYELWNTICFIWGPGGPAQTGVAPNRRSNDRREAAAAN